MNNYQLYRTNVLLGGQMKYDLLLDLQDNTIYTNKLYITPISHNAPCNKYIKTELENYDHWENIKDFYNKTSSTFYEDFTNSSLKNIYPLPQEYKGDSYNSSFEMGCRRIPTYDLYNKQFEFLCPVWIEQLDDINRLTFEIQIYTNNNSTTPIYTNKIHFKQQYVEYFNKYLKYVGLDKGCDWVLNISDRANDCIVHGLNVKTGNISDVKLLTLYNNLIYRERPLLEFNNMIINELNKNKLISCQLFNFNFCFNLQDILNDYLLINLKHEPLYININAEIDNNKLEYRDIFSNHEYIEKLVNTTPAMHIHSDNKIPNIITKTEKSLANVLDYLNDYKHIDLVDKNKLLQSTCHWCLSENPTELFNMYDGFTLIQKSFNGRQFEYKYSNENLNNPYYSGETVDLETTNIFSKGYLYWANNYRIYPYVLKNPNNMPKDPIGIKENDLNKIHTKEDTKNLFKTFFNDLFNTSKYDHMYSKFNTGNCWVKNMNYTDSNNKNPRDIKIMIWQLQNITVDGSSDPGTSGVLTHDEYYKLMKKVKIDYNKWNYNNILFEDKYIHMFYTTNDYEDAKIILLYSTYNPIKQSLLYKNLMDSTNQIIQEIEAKYKNSILYELFNILKKPNKSQLKTIFFKNGLMQKRIAGPTLDCTEIEYWKAESQKIILRWIGKIKPYFIQENNIYSNFQNKKLKFEDLNKNDYAKYSNTLFKPKYPSIGYFTITSQIHNNSIAPGIKYNEVDEVYDNILEWHHYTKNKIFNFDPNIEFTFQLDEHIDNYSGKINTIIKQYFKDHYNIKEDQLNYITGLYKLVHTSIDLSYENDKPKYTYNIQIKLK